jgi:hypothetical protein
VVARKLLERYSELREKCAANDGGIDPGLDMVLWDLAGVGSVADIALTYVEKSSHSIGSGKVERGVEVYLGTVQACARLLGILTALTEQKGGYGASLPAFRIILVKQGMRAREAARW